MRIRKKDSTSNIILVFIQDSSSTTGEGLAGLDETSNIVGGYLRVGETGIALTVDEDVTTEGTYQAPSTAGQVRIGTPANMSDGWYELHFHDDLFIAGTEEIGIGLEGATNMAHLPLGIQLIDNTNKDIYDRIGAPTGANISADLAAVENSLGLVKGTGFDTNTDSLTKIKAIL